MNVKEKRASSRAVQAGKRASLHDFLYNPLVHLLVIVIIGFLAYSNTFHSPFQWDEEYFLTGNPVVKDLSFFTDLSQPAGMSAYSFKNRYIGYLTFALNYRFHGFNVSGYHIVNLAIHLINAILVYLFVMFTFRTPYFRYQQSAVSGRPSADSLQQLSPFTIHHSHFFALAVALLFVSHPLQTEAVTYVFQRFTSLVSMFYMLSLVLYIKGRLAGEHAGRLSGGQAGKPASRQAGKLVIYLLSLLCAVFAMKTKENAFTLPVMMTLYEFLFFRGALKPRILRLLPFLLTMLIIPLAVIQIEGSVGEFMKPMTDPIALGYENLSRSDYLFTQFRVIMTYMRLLLFPVNQNVYYDYPVYHSLFALPVLLSLVFLMSLFGVAVYMVYTSQRALSHQPPAVSDTPLNPPLPGEEVKRGIFHDSLFTHRYSRLVAFGILWFFITLSIESSVLPLAMVIDEYRVYLPSVGFFLAITAAFFLLLSRIAAHKEGTIADRYERFSLFALLIIVIVLSAATYARNILWKDKISLWEDVVSKNTQSPKVYNNLGIAYYEKGLYEKAIEMYTRAISLNPDNFFAYSNLGVTYAATGRIDMAIETLTKSIALDPKNGVAYANLARAFRMKGEFEKAAENYRMAVELDPYNETAFYGLGSTYLILGEFDGALAAYTRFAELSPQNPEAYRGRGMAYLKKGETRRAAEDFRQACALGSRESCAYMKNVR